MEQALDALDLNDEELLLYSRQILLDGWDIEAQEKLKLSNVLIVGCGGIGCLLAELLARAGVGKLSLIDPDTIELSNLQRQIAFNHDDIGFYKAEILAKRLCVINPHIKVDVFNEPLDSSNIETLIQGQDLVLDGCDQFETRYLVNRNCVAQSIPLLSASAIGMQGQLFMIEGDSACYECIFPQSDIDAEMRCSESGVLATTPNVMASLQAHHALLYLGLGKKPLKQKLLLWNGMNLQQRIVHFAKDENCACCRAI